jgi:uncharacterized protein YndB with AHSA1/START domain
MLEITKTIQISSTAKQVFDALTIPEHIKSYFPIDSVESDGRVGGQFVIHGHVDDQPFTDLGTIDRFESGKEFQYTYWSTNHGTDRLPENHMTIRYLLREIDGETHLELQHLNLLREDRMQIMLGVWDFLLGNLKTYAEDRRLG